MKLALFLTLLIVASFVQPSEGFLGNFFKETARKVKGVVGSVGDAVKKGVSTVRDTARDAVDRLRGGVKGAVGTVRDGFRHAFRGVFRGKRSALTLNRLDDVNAVDIAKTFNLHLPEVQRVFYICDVDKNGSLDGREVLTFLGRIEDLAARHSIRSATKNQ